MRHRKTTAKLDRLVGPRKLLLRNLAVSVLLYERVETTTAKAKAVRSLVERCISDGKQDTLTRRRALLAKLAHARAVEKTITVLGPRYRERRGGYTRIIHTRQRAGDGAALSVIALV